MAVTSLPIRTQQQRVPWRWVLIMSLPVGMSAFVEKCSGTALTFTLKKFISDPALITLLGSINIAFGVLVAPWVAWRSDRIWTPLGRRKPFLLTGLLILVGCLIALPMATSLWMLIPIVLLYQFSMDLGYTGPWMPLYYDVIPDTQRGRGMVINRYISFAARLLFMYVLIGRFDESFGMGKLGKALGGRSEWAVTGEQLIYFVAAGLVALTVLLVGFGVRELAPTTGPAHSKPSLRQFFRDLFGSPSTRLLCLPVLASVLMAAKLASLRPLMLTEQFGYTKQQMGNIHAVSMLVNAALVLPLMALLVDRINRLAVFMVCLIVSTIQPIAFWLYVTFLAPGQIPTPNTIIAFHVVDAAFDHAGLMALWPMVFQATRPANRGSISAAFLVVSGLVNFISTNLLGLWVKGYSALTCPPGKHDYVSGYLYIFVVGLVACGATICYAIRHRAIPAEEPNAP